MYNPYFPNRGVNHKSALLTVPESYRNYNGSMWSNTSKSGSFPPEKARKLLNCRQFHRLLNVQIVLCHVHIGVSRSSTA